MWTLGFVPNTYISKKLFHTKIKYFDNIPRVERGIHVYNSFLYQDDFVLQITKLVF